MLEKVFLFTYPIISFFYFFVFTFNLREIFPNTGFLSVLNTKKGITVLLSILFIFFLLGLFLRAKRKKIKYKNTIIILVLLGSLTLSFFTKSYTLNQRYSSPVSYQEALEFAENIKSKKVKVYFENGEQELIYFNQIETSSTKSEKEPVSRLFITGDLITWFLFHLHD